MLQHGLHGEGSTAMLQHGLPFLTVVHGATRTESGQGSTESMCPAMEGALTTSTAL